MSGYGETVGWGVHRHWKVTSTNDLARELREWDAVVADIQEAGRGRYGRVFQSSEGGLWLSAVVPLPGGAAAWTGFGLVVGWAICQWLRSLPLPEARLRWPNDILVGHRKLAGLLLEQTGGDRCVVGVGMNLSNRPWEDDPALAGRTTRLVDEISPSRDREEALAAVLQGIRMAHARMLQEGLAGLHEEINRCWDFGPGIRLHFAEGAAREGRFEGIDAAGALRLVEEGKGESIHPAHFVQRLEEI